MVALLSAPWVAAGQTNQEEPESVFRWRNRPSIQLGDVRIDIRFKTQLDWRTFDPEIEEELFDRRALRGGINGEIGNHVEFQIERDLDPDGEWRDVFARWRTYRQFEVSAGRFKVPFGREELIELQRHRLRVPRPGFDDHPAGAGQRGDGQRPVLPPRTDLRGGRFRRRWRQRAVCRNRSFR